MSNIESATYAEATRRLEVLRTIAGGLGREAEAWWMAGFAKGAEWERGGRVPAPELER
jgi:hypothetical protein